MKRFSLLLAALALVLGTSQCSKEKTPALNGVTQHIVLTASNGNDGSKVSANFVTDALNLTWDETDKIIVSGGATGELKLTGGASTSTATFEGDITKHDGSAVYFTVGSAPASTAFENQSGAEETCEAWIKSNNYFVGMSPWQDNGNYSVTMELQYAVLKLDLSGFGTTEGTTVTISDGTSDVASVKNVTAESTAVYVAVPADGSEKTYTFSGSDWGALKIWTLAPNTFYTKKGDPAGGAIKIEKYVNFGLTSGRLWATCNVGADSPEEYGDYFMWGSIIPNTNDNCCWANAPFNNGASNYNSTYFTSVRNTVCPDDILASEYDAAAQIWKDGWRMPTQAEWQELCDNTESTWTTLNGVNGRLFRGTTEGYTDVALFLPAAGYRDGTSLTDAGSYGLYWSSSLYSGDPHYAYRMYFRSDYVGPQGYVNRCFGFAVRLVR